MSLASREICTRSVKNFLIKNSRAVRIFSGKDAPIIQERLIDIRKASLIKTLIKETNSNGQSFFSIFKHRHFVA